MSNPQRRNAAHDGQLWTVEEVAEYLRIPQKTLYQWRLKGQGPIGKRIGRYLRYRQDDVLRWVDAQ